MLRREEEAARGLGGWSLQRVMRNSQAGPAADTAEAEKREGEELEGEKSRSRQSPCAEPWHVREQLRLRPGRAAGAGTGVRRRNGGDSSKCDGNGSPPTDPGSPVNPKPENRDAECTRTRHNGCFGTAARRRP